MNERFAYAFPVVLVFVVLDLDFSVPSQEIGCEKYRRNDLLCVEWDVKP